MSVAADHQVVRLADEANEDGLIDGATYEDATILGPALLVPIGDLTLDSNTFVGDPNALFIEFPPGTPIQGGIGLRNVTFRHCEFRNVAIAGTPDVIARVRPQFEFPAVAAVAAHPVEERD